MNLPELKSALIEGSTQNLYVFVGTEAFVMNTYVQKVAEARDQVVSRPNRVEDVYATLPLRGQQPLCYVVADDKELPKHEGVWDKLDSQLACGSQTLILTYTKLDKRSKFAKHFEDRTVEFPRMGMETLRKYVARELGNAEDALADKLIESAEYDFQRLLLECDKIKTLATIEGTRPAATIKRAFELTLVQESFELGLFDIVDIVMTGAPGAAMVALETLLEAGESPVGILAILYNSCRDMMVAKVAGKDGDVVARTGMTQWQLNSARKRAFKYDAGTLVWLTRELRRLEKCVKTGVMTPELAVQQGVLLCLDSRK